jgi:hypothetical protein
MNPNKVSQEEIWDEKNLSEINDWKMPSGVFDDSQRLNDDFFFMDISFDDDFQGLLDVGSSTDLEIGEGVRPTNVSNARELGSSKRAQEEENHSPKKKRKSLRYVSPALESIDPENSTSSIIQHSLSSEDMTDIQTQYRNALHQLALSMRRSEVTRNEILRFRKETEAHAQLELAEYRTFSNAEYFLKGYRSTLTLGLDQSRQMLQGLLSKGNNLYTL